MQAGSYSYQKNAAAMQAPGYGLGHSGGILQPSFPAAWAGEGATAKPDGFKGTNRCLSGVPCGAGTRQGRQPRMAHAWLAALPPRARALRALGRSVVPLAGAPALSLPLHRTPLNIPGGPIGMLAAQPALVSLAPRVRQSGASCWRVSR